MITEFEKIVGNLNFDYSDSSSRNYYYLENKRKKVNFLCFRAILRDMITAE